MPTTLHLYWCTTEDGDEDWFMVATSARQAARLHEDAEGYEEGEARAERIAEVPAGVQAKPGWPDQATIEACGGEFLPYRPAGGPRDAALRESLGQDARVVRFGERVFVEGDMVSAWVQERPDVEPDA